MKSIKIILMLLIWCSVNNRGFSQANIQHIERHFSEILNTAEYRNYRHIESLNQVANYVKMHFEKYADTTYFQSYEVDGEIYKNVIAVLGSENEETIVIGGHYDVCGDQDGADDNASGLIGVLELARLFHGKKLKYRFELVAYTLEEPPFFRTQNMGSYQHAKSLYERNEKVYGMIALDMIGYFEEEKKSQTYPIKLLSWFLGSKGDFIMVVNKWGKGKFARRFSGKFAHQKEVKVRRLAAPKSVEGLDWSDHLNFWNFGYSASLITDTGPLRNPNYHRKSDTIETINLPKMAKVIDQIYQAIIKLK